jgi:hypothetical protein
MTQAELNPTSFIHRVRRWAQVFLPMLMLLGIASEAMADALSVEVDRREIHINETLNLVVRYEGRQVNSDPDFSVLNQFDILSNNKSTQHSIINGNVSAFTEWRLTLAPRNTGQLLIPPLTLRGEHSKPVTITVKEASRDPISGKEDVFLEISVDKSTVYVQEQFIVTYRLYFNQSVDSLDGGQFSVNQARFEELPRVDYQTTLGHTAYGVAEFRYAVFADASGVITIPERTWSIRTTDQPGMSRFGFGSGRYRLHRAKTDALTITVEPKPADFPSNSPWLPAKSVQLEERWSRSAADFRVGEPITRTVTIRAEGAGAEQLPPLFDERGTADLKFYPDKPDQDKQLTADGIKSSRTESVAIVPTRAGEVTLPEVSVAWWNTQEKRVERAVLPARTLNIAPAEGQAAAATAAPRDSAAPLGQYQAGNTAPVMVTKSGIWPWISALLLLCNLITLFIWWRQRNRHAVAETPLDNGPSGTVKDALRRLRQACQRRDAAATRGALLDWAQARWGGRPLLQDIGRARGAVEVQRELGKLEAVLFAGATNDVDYPVLAAAAERLSRSGSGSSISAELPTLYKAS